MLPKICAINSYILEGRLPKLRKVRVLTYAALGIPFIHFFLEIVRLNCTLFLCIDMVQMTARSCSIVDNKIYYIRPGILLWKQSYFHWWLLSKCLQYVHRLKYCVGKDVFKLTLRPNFCWYSIGDSNSFLIDIGSKIDHFYCLPKRKKRAA